MRNSVPRPATFALRKTFGMMLKIHRTVIRLAFIALMALQCLAVQAAPRRIMPYPGAWRMDEYLPLLHGKRVALVINQTSLVRNTLLADTLLKRGVALKKIFVPEHGLRGGADAGAHIANSKDPKTGLPVISLYGTNKKPSKTQLADVDIVVYDLQDVGVRFYTYISTLQYCMEACAENGKALMVLDRPNPLGDLVDGPVLDTSLRSFVGMQPIPIAYGMTAGEYANMLRGEGWVKGAKKLTLRVIPCQYWMHNMTYSLPVAPSPNLRDMEAVYCYPSLCLFEGTVVSLGRGTDKPFRQWGHPDFSGKAPDSFRPVSTPGATHPPHEGLTCYGRVLTDNDVQAAHEQIQIGWLLEAYQWYGARDGFFTNFFEKLAGTRQLRQQIIAGKTEAEIRKSWEPGLTRFKAIRQKYLLYR